MSDYFYNNKPVPESQLSRLAEEKGMSLEDFVESMGITTEKPEADDVDIYDTDIGWDDYLKTTFVGKGIRTASKFFEKGALAPAMAEVAAEDAIDEIARGKRKDSDDWKLQAAKLEKEINKVFLNDDGSVNEEGMKQILDGDETLQNVLIGKGGQPVRNPERALKDYFHEKIKGFGWNDERNVDPNTGQLLYGKLTNRDIDEVIDRVFDTQYAQESTNNRNDRIAYGEGGDDKSRNSDINTYTGTNLKVAKLVEQINHGTFPYTTEDGSVITKENAIEKLSKLKETQGKLDPLFNYNTGKVIYAKSLEDKENLLKEDGVEVLKDKSADYQGLTLKELGLEYKRSSLALGGLNKELGEVLEFDTEGYDYTDDAILRPMALRDYLNQVNPGSMTRPINYIPKGYTEKQWEQKIERLRDDKIEYTANHEALKRMYLLNDGLLDIEKSGTETALKSFIEPFVGRYGTDALMGGQSERVILDKVGEKYGELGIPIDDKEEKYLERDLGETINEGLFGSGRILAEFYAVGKFLKPIEAATGLARYTKYLTSSRYRSTSGRTFSEATTKARALNNGMSVKNYTKRAGWVKVDPTIGMRAKSLGIAGLMEGAKFEGISRFDTGGEEGGFATGFGFGVAGRMIAPLAPYLAKKGVLRDFDFKRVPTFTGPLTKRVYTPGNVSGQALFQQFVSAPASFVVGSEAGEIMHGIVDDAFGNKQYSQFMDEHYGDYGEVGKRMISNYFIGVGFGMAGPHGSMFKGFADFKSETGIRKTRDIAYNNARNVLQEGGFTKAEIAESGDIVKYETYVIDGQKIKRPVRRNQTAEWQARFNKSLSEKQREQYEKHSEVYHGMNGKLLQLQRAKGYMDPLQARDMIEKDMQNIIDSNKKAGIETKIEVIHNDNLMPGQKKMVTDAYVVVDGKTRTYKFNAERYTPDVKAHEVSHDFFETQFEKDALFKGEFMSSMNNIAKKIKLQRLITEKEAASLGKPNRVGEKMNLSEAISLEKNMGEFDGNSVINNQRISQWELFSHIAQQIGTKANYLEVKNSDGYMRLGKLIKDIGKKNNQKYNLSLESDVVRWFRDYSKNIEKGIDTRPMFKELESVVDYGATKLQRELMVREGMRPKVERGYESKDLDVQKNTFLDNQRKSLESGKETALYSIDKNLFNNDGSLKYKTLNEFKADATAYTDVWQKIFGERGVFDTQIKEGMTEKGVPDQYIEKLGYNPMNEFVRKVKDNLLTRLNKNFNPQGAGGSLYGYFGKVAIPYEKLRVQEDYVEGKKTGVEGKVRLEDIGEMQAPIEARVKRFETENILEQQFKEAKDKKGGKEIKTEKEEGRIFSEMMGRDKSGVQTKITDATKKQKIDLDATKPIYKDLKKWLTEVELIERDGKKVKPTKEADAKPIGVLAEVMKVVSAEYGVPLKRLLANQTLDGTMRDKARDYIKNKVTEIREGVFPEGETPSGIATGAANTSWKSLYVKGARVKVSEGASKKAGQKFSQTKRTDITNAEILEKVGINPKTGEYAKGTKFDSAIKELIKFDATIEAKQALTTLGRGIFSDSVIGEMGAGRPEGMASKNLEKQGFADQVNFLSEVQGKTFKKMFERNMASIEDPVKAINKTLTEYFTDYKKRGNGFGISNADLRTIGKELHKEYQFTKLTPTRIASKAAKAIEMPNDLKSIDIKAGLEPTPFSLNTLSDIVEARAVTRVVAKALVEKYGDGVYEAMLLRGESGGKGVGTFSNLADMVSGFKKGQNRFALHEASEAAIDFMSDIINTAGKNYSGPISTMVEGQGNKAGQMKKLIDRKTGEWNQKALNEAYNTGEFSKKVLKDAVTALREAYKNNDITHTQARQWVEIHGGPMSGLIKLAGSFAVVPNMSPKKMFELYPERAPKKNTKGEIERYDKDVLYKTGKNKGKVEHKKGDAIYESNYVLEHTTPAQYVKARIYDYIINGGEAKKSAMDLTLKDYHTTLIPKQFDVMVNKTLQTNLPSWHLPGMDPISSRYYEANHPSDFGFGLRNFKTGKVYDYHPNLTVKQKQKLGKQLGEINNKLFPKGLKKAAEGKLNSKNLEDLKNISKALELGRKKNKEARGMSTWDFDDTLATTKSGVRARIPNADGLPKPNRKVIFLAGGAGSGKGNVIKKLNLKGQGFKIVNSDISLEWLKKNNGLPENMNDLTKEQRSTLGSLQHQARGIAKRKMMKYKGNADGVVVDGTGGSIKSMEALVKEFKEKGYDVSMLFVETSLETALARNKARTERSLLDKIVERNHESVQGNKNGFKKMFGERFMEVQTDKLKQADAMPKELVDKMNDFVSGYEKIRLDAEQFATKGKEILDRGGKFDFTEFNVVTGGEKGPFFQKALDRAKKFGTKDQFVLTARPPEAAVPIYEFLKSQGLEIPLKNITGLGNSTGEAKAMWMLKKFSEGYNDMYFADDAIQNVKAVRDVLNQLDIKSKVQQALQSKDLNRGINNIMEHSLNIGSEKVFSKAEAKVRGKDIKRRRVFMRDSAADLELLIEPLYGKGKEGIKNKKWFKEEFVMPFEKGIRDYNTARQSAKNDYMSLRKQNKDVVKEISKPVEGTAFTNDMAMRVYLWNKAGYKIPDLAKTTEAKLVQHIASNPKLQAYAENFARITKQEKGLKEPGENWWGETMAGEVTNINRGVSRKQYLQEWIDVKNEIFTEANLNKMESKLGTEWRENITDMFDRMETGRTRSLKMDRGSAIMMNYLNGGIGTIMNFNTRSAVLQTISTTNFLNMRENNPIAAARAMGNVKQFAKDFKYIMNSDMLKQRRDGLAMNVTEAEIASAAASSKNPVQSIISKVLKAGYLPTKMADSFAISFGGATFYRNRVKMYEKQGMETKQAEKQAFLDFQVIAERTQQSSRADLLSKQQTSLIGRFILPFANTPMQMNRAGMKDILDISKGRYKNSAEVAEKVGRISYYMGAQVAIFAGLQSALFAMLLNDDDVPEEKIANTKSMMLNTTADSMLRGFGVQGAVLSATKNALQEYFKQSAKPGFTADYSEVAEDLLNISPPIGSKFGMLDRAGDRKKWAKIRKNDEFKFELGNPSLEASLMTIQATTNAPVYSPYQNLFNMQHALSDQYETWQRVLMGAGWTPYSVGVETEDKKDKKGTSRKGGRKRSGGRKRLSR